MNKKFGLFKKFASRYDRRRSVRLNIIHPKMFVGKSCKLFEVFFFFLFALSSYRVRKLAIKTHKLRSYVFFVLSFVNINRAFICTSIRKSVKKYSANVLPIKSG